ncbi:MAG: RIP metalloprotease [Oceanicaulis sp.]|uniref:M50 family metallopeptidase n=1 Tax=Glycocaulis sp. TaxID=1969725 RepID=UPI0025C37693|nr:M50 family metallopeptidase [Glycocaulis sp.]MCC5981644.1 RIP metalloprotease [Oceanicaulis sp.]MCH8521374.1 RIP metalloprotease [Glycocaulis sp.]
MTDILGSGLLSIAAFVAVISFVVVIHELGHYFAGRAFGVHAEAFSIGFGPTLFSWKDKRGTIWRIAGLPLGGYVRFLGDANAASAPDHATLERLRAERADADQVYHFKPVWQRAVIVAAGPAANFVLAILLFAAIGMTRGETVIEPRVGSIVEGSPAETAGFEPGDVLLTIDGQRVRTFTDLSQSVMTRAGTPMRFVVERSGREVHLAATPRREMRPDGLGGTRAFGFLGVGLAEDATITQRRFGPVEAVGHGVSRTADVTVTIVDYLGRLVTFRASLEHINGPLGIATTAGQIANTAVAAPAADPASHDLVSAASRLATSLLLLAALLSVAIGLMNLLPIPVLDGGHLVYYAYEAVAKRPPSPGVQAMGFRAGLVLILGLLVVATWNDLSYLVGLFS